MKSLIQFYEKTKLDELADVIGKQIHDAIEVDAFKRLKPFLLYKVLDRTEWLDEHFVAILIDKILECQNLDIVELMSHIKVQHPDLILKKYSYLKRKENNVVDDDESESVNIGNVEEIRIRYAKPDGERLKCNIEFEDGTDYVKKINKQGENIRSIVKSLNDLHRQFSSVQSDTARKINKLDMKISKGQTNIDDCALNKRLDKLSEHINCCIESRISSLEHSLSDLTEKYGDLQLKNHELMSTSDKLKSMVEEITYKNSKFQKKVLNDIISKTSEIREAMYKDVCSKFDDAQKKVGNKLNRAIYATHCSECEQEEFEKIQSIVSTEVDRKMKYLEQALADHVDDSIDRLSKQILNDMDFKIRNVHNYIDKEIFDALEGSEDRTRNKINDEVGKAFVELNKMFDRVDRHIPSISEGECDIKTPAYSSISNKKSYVNDIFEICASQDAKILNHYLNNQPDQINVENEDGLNPLNYCAKNGFIIPLKTLIQRGANPNTRSNGKTALHYACKFGHYDVAKYLIKNGVRVDVLTEKGQTPLHFACKHNQPLMASFLLGNRANVECQDHNDLTPVYIAATRGNAGVVKVLVKHNANINYVPICYFLMLVNVLFLSKHARLVTKKLLKYS